MFKASLLLLSAMSFSSVYATSVYKSGDWYVDDLSTRANPNGQCMMVTEHKEGSVLYRLELVRKKNVDSPLEIQLRVKGRGAQAHLFNLNNGSTIVLAAAGVEGNANLFWNIPQDTAGLIAHFEARKDLKLRPADGSRDQGIEFDESGFAKVKAEFSKRCLGNRDVFNASFERAFVKDARRAINPTALDLATVAELRSLLGQGYEAFKLVGANQNAVNQLRSRFSRELNEAQSLNSSITGLGQSELPAIQQAQLNNNTLETQTRSELARLTALIPQQQSALTAATSARDRAEAAVAPLRAEHESRESSAQSSRAQVNNAQGRISEIDRTINNLELTIRQLEQEQDSLLNNVRRAESDMRPARVEERRAEADFRAWNPERELRERIQRNPRWHEAMRALPAAQVAENDLEKLRDAAHDDKEVKEKAKEACQRIPGQDCTALATAHRDALALYRRYEADEDRAQAARVSIQNTITNIETIARNDVNAVTAQLTGRLNAANQVLANLEATIVNGNRRAREISQYEIPRLGDQIGSLERERPLQVSEMNRSAPEAQRLENELIAYERRVGWVAKNQTLDNAQASMNDAQDSLSVSLRGKAVAEQTISRTQAEKARLGQLFTDKQAQLAQAQARLVVVNQSLVPFEQENAVLQASAATLGGDFDNLSAQFDAKIP